MREKFCSYCFAKRPSSLEFFERFWVTHLWHARQKKNEKLIKFSKLKINGGFYRSEHFEHSEALQYYYYYLFFLYLWKLFSTTNLDSSRIIDTLCWCNVSLKRLSNAKCGRLRTSRAYFKYTNNKNKHYLIVNDRRRCTYIRVYVISKRNEYDATLMLKPEDKYDRYVRSAHLHSLL